METLNKVKVAKAVDFGRPKYGIIVDEDKCLLNVRLGERYAAVEVDQGMMLSPGDREYKAKAVEAVLCKMFDKSYVPPEDLAPKKKAPSEKKEVAHKSDPADIGAGLVAVLDPSDYTVADMAKVIAGQDDAGVLQAMRTLEYDNKNRKSILIMIDQRLADI